jgi:hypothetical protein
VTFLLASAHASLVADVQPIETFPDVGGFEGGLPVSTSNLAGRRKQVLKKTNTVRDARRKLCSDAPSL